jgi:hypothetical protein
MLARSVCDVRFENSSGRIPACSEWRERVVSCHLHRAHTETIMAFSRRALNGHEGSSASTSLRHSGVRSAQITDLRVGHGRAPGQTRTCDPARRSRASASEGISDTQVWARIHGQATITRQSSGAVRKRNKSYVSRAAHRIELTTFGCSRRAALIVDKRGTNMFPTIA